LDVLNDVLGGGMSSRLFQRVREELGAAYYIRSGADLMLEHGYFEVSSGVDHTKIDQVIRAIVEELRKLTQVLVGKEELQKAKDHLTGNLLLSLEGSDDLANFYGGQEILTRNLETPEHMIQKLQKVSADEIRRLARAIFKPETLNLAIIGPYKKVTNFTKLLKF